MRSLETTPIYFCYPEIVLYLPSLALVSDFEATGTTFVLLVASTISMVSTVSSLGQQVPFTVFGHCPHHTASADATHLPQ